MIIINKLKKGIYFVVGKVVLRHFYAKFVFRSKHFSKPGSLGWKWLFKCFIWQKIFGINRHVPWPVSFKSSVMSPENIKFHPDDINNFMTQGNYFQAADAILTIGKGTYIAPNTALITENHDLMDPNKRGGGKNVTIGKKCWIGFGAIILPGVVLGDHTVVGAGAVVTKSFSDGHCVIVGNPAKVIKILR